MKRLYCLLATLCCFCWSQAHASLWNELKPFEVTEDTPIVFMPSNSTLVLEDSTGAMTLDEALRRKDEFKKPNDFGSINPMVHYWIVQKIQSNLKSDRSYGMEPGGRAGWLSLTPFVLDGSGQWHPLKPTGPLTGYSFLSDIDPALPGSAKVTGFFSDFILKQASTVTLLTHAKPLASAPPRTQVLRMLFIEKFLEVRRFGIWVTGGLTGILLSLLIFSWYSFYRNRDRAGLMYGLWIFFALVQAMAIPTQDGYHFSEFLFNANDLRFGVTSFSIAVFVLSSVGQLNFYFLFSSAYLQIAKYYPKTQWLVYFLVVYVVLFNLLLLLYAVNIPPKILYLGNALIPILVLVFLYKAAFERYRQGMGVALFWLIASLPYLIFRFIFVAGLMGYPSPFIFLPESGMAYLLQNTYVSQAISVGLEAIIMSLAVIARNNWIQQELTKSLAAQKTLAENQKSLVENQNKVLELTVAARTKELAEQHKELDMAHQLMVGSVNYASRLQRSQLPRPLRIDGRFVSFATIWQPRDTIGGDVYWLSSSEHAGSFAVAVADCTGHGVPGAMLSLLVSNSLERIYAHDSAQDPAEALLLLDHYVRSGLNQDRPGSESDDGCDAILLQIDPQNKKVAFAGAKLGFFHLRGNGEVMRLGGARCSLGYQTQIAHKDRPVTREIEYSPGDLFAIATDGVTDQIGGPTGRVSYGYRRLEAILKARCHESAHEITKAVQEDFKQWQGEQIRRDDITLVVFKM